MLESVRDEPSKDLRQTGHQQAKGQQESRFRGSWPLTKFRTFMPNRAAKDLQQQN
jgi:hypothetical protein